MNTAEEPTIRAAPRPGNLSPVPHYGRIGMIARWQPVHRGHAAVLRALSDHADRALIGIGSSNRHSSRCPFSYKETADMIDLVLAGRDNTTLIPVPDLDDGPRWRTMVVALFGLLDLFVTDNPYVTSLLVVDYTIARPISLVPEEEKIVVDGTMVRRAMARGEGWQELVPERVAEYITAKRLDERFRREFGLATLAMDAR